MLILVPVECGVLLGDAKMVPALEDADGHAAMRGVYTDGVSSDPGPSGVCADPSGASANASSTGACADDDGATLCPLPSLSPSQL